MPCDNITITKMNNNETLNWVVHAALSNKSKYQGSYAFLAASIKEKHAINNSWFFYYEKNRIIHKFFDKIRFKADFWCRLINQICTNMH